MSMSEAKSGFLKGVIDASIIQKHAKDRNEPKGGGDLPAGIRTGIAHLDKVGFAQYKSGKDEGKWYFFISGVVQEPITHATPQGVVRCRGRYARQQIKAYETPGYNGRKGKSRDDNISAIMDVLRWVGGETYLDDCKTEADLEKKCLMLARLRPYFRFRTWSPSQTDEDRNSGREPQVFVSVEPSDDLASYKPSHEPGTVRGMKDGTDESNGSPSNGRKRSPVEPEPNETEESAEFDETQNAMIRTDDKPNFATLAEEAENGEEEAQQKLQALAEELDVSHEFAAAKDYAEATKIVQAAWEVKHEGDEGEPTTEEPTAEEPEEPEEKPNPVKGQVWNWYFIDSKTKKRTTKPMQVVIEKVSMKHETADVAQLKDKTKKYVGVKWADLEPTE